MFRSLFRKLRFNVKPLFQLLEAESLNAGLSLKVITAGADAAQRLEAARLEAGREALLLLRRERDEFRGSQPFLDARAARDRADAERAKLARAESARETVEELWRQAVADDAANVAEVEGERDKARAAIEPLRERIRIVEAKASGLEGTARVLLGRHLNSVLFAFQQRANREAIEATHALAAAIEAAGLAFLEALSRKSGAGFGTAVAESVLAEIDPLRAPIPPGTELRARSGITLHGGDNPRKLQVGDTFTSSEVPDAGALIRSGAAERVA